MNKVLMGLNPENGHDFVAVYLDDVIVLVLPPIIVVLLMDLPK